MGKLFQNGLARRLRAHQWREVVELSGINIMEHIHYRISQETTDTFR